MSSASFTITYAAAYLVGVSLFGVGIYAGIVMERIVRREGEDHR